MKEIKEPDLNAPRFRKTKENVIDSTFFKRFKTKYPKYNKIKDIDLRNITTTHNINLWKAAIDNRDGVELPEGLGNIFIGSCLAPKAANPDYTVSFKYKTRLKHRNFESDNYIAKIFYSNYINRYKFKNRELWQFKGYRDFTRSVSAAYPSNWKLYIQVENFANINRIFKKASNMQFSKLKTIEDLEGYDEFNMD